MKVPVPTFVGLDWQGKPVATGSRLMEQMNAEANIVVAANVATAKGPKAAFLHEQMHPLNGILPPDDDPRSGSFPTVRALADGSGWTYDTTLIIDESVAPQEADYEHFLPGVVVGRIYTWSYKDEKVLCAADVVARSSAELKVIVTPGDKATEALMNDLRHVAMRAGIADLVAAGPRVSAADAGGKDAGALDAGARSASKAR